MLDRVYLDVVGPKKTSLSIERSKYFAFFDSYSEYSLVHFIHQKSGVASAVVEMIWANKNHLNDKAVTITTINRRTIKWLQMDGGGEYIGHKLQNWLEQNSINHEVTTAYLAEPISSVKRLSRAVVYPAVTMPISNQNLH